MSNDNVVDLTVSGHYATNKEVSKTLVAIFKDEPMKPRVLADSENFLAYTLKNGCTLRLIARANNMKGRLKAHTNPIHAVRFVNYRSNVAASSSKDEFYVWVVNNDNPLDANPANHNLTVKLYFKLVDQVTVCSFSFFINTSVGTPDLLVLYNNTAAVLESSKLIRKFTNEPLEASLVKDSRELRELGGPVTPQTMCCINNAGWFAFTTEDTFVAACTLRNRGTPAWPVCDDAPVRGLELLDTQQPEDPSMLLASCDTKVFQWKLTGQSEPSLLRTFTFGASIVAMLSSKTTFVIFNSNFQVALVEARQRDGFHATIYPITTAVRAGSICFSRLPSYGCVLIDTQTQIEMYQLTVERYVEARKAVMAAISANTGDPATENSSLSPEDGDNLNKSAALSLKSEQILAHRVSSPVADPAILSVTAKNTTTSIASVRSKMASPATTTAVTTSSGSSLLSNLLQQVQRGNLRTTQPQLLSNPQPTSATFALQPTTVAAPAAEAVATATETATATVVKDMSPSLQVNAPATTQPSTAGAVPLVGRVQLHNTTLPQCTDGPLAAAICESDESIRREVAHLSNICKNINQILCLAPVQVIRDHEQLLTLALEAQMTALQSAGVTVGNATADQPVVDATPSPNSVNNGAKRDQQEAFNTYAIMKLIAPVAQDIAKGVTHGIRNTLRTELDNALRTVLNDTIRESQKQVMKRRLDDALNESTSFFSNVVTQRLNDFASRELREVLGQINASLNALVAQNHELQNCIREITNSSVLADLNAARDELRELKAALRAGDVRLAMRGISEGAPGSEGVLGSFSAVHPSPENILNTAKALLEKAKMVDALEYILLARSSALTMQLFNQLSDDHYSAFINDEQITEELWGRVLAQLILPGAAETSEDHERVAQLLLDVLSERETLLRRSTAKAQQFMSDMRHFIARSKQKITSRGGLSTLKDLEKNLQ